MMEPLRGEMEAMETLKDKTAVGRGGGGISRAIALALADAGANVVLADIDEDAARCGRRVRARGVRSAGVWCDVEAGFGRGTGRTAFAEFGAVHVPHNNAGVTWRPTAAF